MRNIFFKLLGVSLSLWLAGCNLTTDHPVFTAEDAADIQLESGYYATGTDVAYIKVIGGKTVVNTQTDSRMPYEALAVDLGEGTYLLQYGKINETVRTYVLFRYNADGRSISTAVYDCSKDAVYFRNFGIKMEPGDCRMSGVTKERLIRLNRALAKALPADSWHKSLRAMAPDDGAGMFKERDSYSGRSPSQAR